MLRLLDKYPAAPNHPGIDVIRSSVTGNDATLVAVNNVTLAGDPVGLVDHGQRKGRLEYQEYN